MERDDMAAGVRLCRSAGWNQLSRDWEIFLTLSPQGNSVCIGNDGQVIGTVATIRYENRFAWIGMVLVDPLHRRRGIGRKLLEEAIQILHDEDCVKLDATPAGREVYTKLGFQDEYALSRMVVSEKVRLHPGSSLKATPLTSQDLMRIQTWDRQVFGADRLALLSWMLEGAPALALKVEDGKKIKGYCLGRHGAQYTHIGPVVADTIEVARALVVAALETSINEAVILDVPDHDDWRRWLESAGFSMLRPFVRMYLGDNRYPGIPSHQYAILGPEFG